MPRITPDTNDVIVMGLNDGPGTHINTGTTGSADNWTDYGSPISGVPGVFSINGSTDAIYIPSSYLIGTIRNGAGGSADTIISPNISLSGWVFLRRHTNFFGEIFNKQFYANSWSNPFLTFGFQTLNTSNGVIDLYITTDGVLQTLRAPSNHALPVGRWCHLAGTWDGSTLSMYINGSLAISGTYSGTIDYGTVGGRGLWYVGGIPGSSTNQEAPVIVQDIRVANVARPQSYFANIYYNGFIP